MKLSAQYLHDYTQFHIVCAEDGRSLADEGCTCWQNAPCYQCMHPGNPRGLDEPECWESAQDYNDFHDLVATSSAFLVTKDLHLSGGRRLQCPRRWLDYAGRTVDLVWDTDENAPLFRALGRNSYRSAFYTTAEAAFVAASLCNWGDG